MASVKDRFDKLPRTRGRVGAHRGTRTRGLGWLWFLVALAAIAGLTAAALFVIPIVTGQPLSIPWIGAASSAPTAAETSNAPEIDDPTQIDPARGITIIVLNGTPVAGLQDTLFQSLQEAGWPMKSKGNAGDRKQLDTVIYYSNPTDIDVARGLISAIGVGEVQAVGADQYPGAAITIVLGEDSPLYPQPTDAGTDTGAVGP